MFYADVNDEGIPSRNSVRDIPNVSNSTIGDIYIDRQKIYSSDSDGIRYISLDSEGNPVGVWF